MNQLNQLKKLSSELKRKVRELDEGLAGLDEAIQETQDNYQQEIKEYVTKVLGPAQLPEEFIESLRRKETELQDGAPEKD